MPNKFHILILGAACASCASGGPPHLNAAQQAQLTQVEQSLQKDGGRATLRRYFGPGEGSAYGLISTGDPRGIALGLRMLQYSDAMYTLMLRSSLAGALYQNPLAVLPLIGDGTLDADQTCTPFTDPEVTPPAKARADLQRMERVLESVHRSDLQEPKSECLDRVRRGYQSAAAMEQRCKSDPDSHNLPACLGVLSSSLPFVPKPVSR